MFVITTVVSVIFDISEKLSEFLTRGASFQVILFDYYINFVPNIINLLSPIIIFIAALYFTSRLANNTEFLAVLSSGTSYYRILRPYLMVSILLALVDLGMKNYVIPRSYSRQIKFEFQYIDSKTTFQAVNIHRQIDKNSYFYAKSVDYQGKRAERFTIEKFNAGQLVYKLRSDEAFYDSTKGNWNVKRFYIRTIDGMHETLKTGDSMRVKIPITIADFSNTIKSMPSMTTPELNSAIETEKLKGNENLSFYMVEKFRRFSMPLDIIILVMIAVALATRKVRGGIGMHLIIGILIALSQVMFVRFTTTFATKDDFPPLLAVFIPTIVYGIVAFGLIKTTPK